MTNEPYQSMPPLSDDEYEALRADIATRGVLVPVEVDENGAILDGHHRHRACVELGITPPTVVRTGLSEAEKHEHSLRLNLARRHVTQAQRRDLIRRELERDSGRSDRAIARLVGASHPTVAAVRREINGVVNPSTPGSADMDSQQAREWLDEVRATQRRMDGLAAEAEDLSQRPAPMCGPYRVHPMLAALPNLPDDELHNLAASIKRLGLIKPIMLTHDKTTIVDGRQRYLACEIATVDPVFDTLPADADEVDTLDFIVSMNVVRQSLTKDQRAVIHVQVEELRERVTP